MEWTITVELQQKIEEKRKLSCLCHVENVYRAQGWCVDFCSAANCTAFATAFSLAAIISFSCKLTARCTDCLRSSSCKLINNLSPLPPARFDWSVCQRPVSATRLPLQQRFFEWRQLQLPPLLRQPVEQLQPHPSTTPVFVARRPIVLRSIWLQLRQLTKFPVIYRNRQRVRQMC